MIVRLMLVAGMVASLGILGGCSRSQQEVRVIQSPPTQGSGLYVANRAPLVPAPLLKLPIGAIEPRGWVRYQLELEAAGMVGRLPEISRWCNFEGNAWADPDGKGHSGWEEMPYWLKGYGDLGYVLKDEKIRKETARWIEAILATQREDGWFGPRGLLTSLSGKPDLWPNMLVLNILQSWHEVTGDARVVPFMTRYFRWQLDFPEKDFMAGYWPKMRAGDNIESIHWLYNRTGEKWLLELADKVHRNAADWSSDVINWHGVNITQGFREPAMYYVQAKDPRFLDAAERNYQKVMGMYGQFPGGMFAADENARPGYDDPRQGAETCSIVEFMHSFEMMTKLTGDPLWADRCEDVAFNSFPPSMTPDQKALHYLTGANMVLLDRHNHAPGIQNGGMMLSYSAFERYRCCQHNVAHGWPYYAQELWHATLDGGLAASLYAPSAVTAKVGNGASQVRITSETNYPFSEEIRMTVSLVEGKKAVSSVRFPLYLRVPRWCDAAEVSINGRPLAVQAKPLSYIRIERVWNAGDTVVLRLPMKLDVKVWTANKNAVSVNYGPLSFSLKIEENWVKSGGTADWPEYEVFPGTPWNYGLVLNEKDPAASFEIIRKPGLLAGQPFTPESAPIELRAKAKKIPNWKLDQHNLVAVLQPGPIKSSEPVETVTLLPMGCARLRISAFPRIGDGPDARPWLPEPKMPEASHCFESDTTTALNDGRIPKNSADSSIPRFTWWPRKASTEWVQYEYPAPRSIKAVEVYWFDDTGRGFCRPPANWRVLYRDGETWKPVNGASGYGVALDRFNRTTFEPVQTTAVRLEVRLQEEFSGGILEWKVE